jgi:hypothetical protein
VTGSGAFQLKARNDGNGVALWATGTAGRIQGGAVRAPEGAPGPLTQ